MEYAIWIFIIADAAVLSVLYCAALLLRLYPRLYVKTMHVKYRKDYFPRIAVFIPCKESGEEFEDRIREFANLSHPQIRIFFITENASEPAYTAIGRHITGKANCRLVTAGSATSCSQKNHNLLAGIEASGEKDDIYLFLDADTRVSLKRIKRVIMPLSSDEVAATSGFQWCKLLTRTLGERLYSFMVAIQWFGIGQPFMNFLWGGMTAVRRRDFEQLGIKQYWAKTVVDDITLLRIIKKKGTRTVHVPFCIDDAHRKTGSTCESIRWFVRQILFLKYYRPGSWLAGITPLIYSSLRMLVLIPALGLTVFTRSPFFAQLSLLSVCYLVLTSGYCRMIKRKCRDNHSAFSWVLLSPLYVILASVSAAISVFAVNLKWKDATYVMGGNGIVKAVRRQRSVCGTTSP